MRALTGALMVSGVVVSVLLFWQASNAAINGQVVDQTGNPIAGAKVVHHYSDPTNSRFTVDVVSQSGSDGRFSFPDVSEPWGTIAASAEGYVPSSAYWIRDESKQVDEVKVVLFRTADVTIEVQDSRGEPVAGARLDNARVRHGENFYYLRHTEHSDWPGWSARSDAGGKLTIPLPAGTRVEPRIFHDELAPAELEEFEAVEGTVQTVSLPDTITIDLHIDGVAKDEEVYIDLRREPFKHPSTILRHVRLQDGRVRLAIEPGEYQSLWVYARDKAVLPQLQCDFTARKFVPFQESQTLKLQAVPTALVRGRVVNAADGKAIGNAYINSFAQHEQAKQDAFEQDWAFVEGVSTRSDGSFTVRAIVGDAKLDWNWAPEELGGFIAGPEFGELTVPPQGVDLGDLTLQPLRPVTGRVLKPDGSPAVGTVVRPSTYGLRHVDSVETNDEGRFELTIPYIPEARSGGANAESISVVAFDPHTTLAGAIEGATDDVSSFDDVSIQLSSVDPWWPIREHFTDQKSPEEGARDRTTPNDSLLLSKFPEFVGDNWWNVTDPLTQESLRGKWVLIDYFFTNCGPCRAETPKLKKLHEVYAGDRFALVGVHIRRERMEEAAEYIASAGIPFPVVYDGDEERLLKAGQPLGVEGFPSYVLLDPEGRVVLAPRVGWGPSLRMNKLEIIRALLLSEAHELPRDLFWQGPTEGQ